MKFCIFLFQIGLATITLYEKIHKYDDQYDKMKRAYDKNISKFKKEQRKGDPTVLLVWWGPQYPLLKRIEKECGACWITHEKHLEKEAAGLGCIIYNLFFPRLRVSNYNIYSARSN